ncbi:hypothetical protein C0991_001083 [Blastosporella zonata]|nr:hypothetical protein C0991_001083 [Blastosporella zonata]
MVFVHCLNITRELYTLILILFFDVLSRWNTMPTFADILDALEADILCFQEVKSSRSGLSKGCAVPTSYHSFFSFPVMKSGYSGVSTYVRAASATPVKAEEGLCGIVQPKPPLTAEEHVSAQGAYPHRILDADDINYKGLDSEGRTLVLDFGLFVLINVYCPNDGNGTDERNKYKADFHTVLEARVKGLVEVEGREVIVVGDLNACAAVIDHCEGQIMVARGLAEGLEGEEGFWGKESRRWMRGWMVSEDGGRGGHMTDITRRLWPDRKGMYTCWNTKISARDSNYGTRIDYIMITRGLLPWVKAADIQPQIKGSDHCPVYLDLHDEIVDASGVTIKLQDAMGFKTGSSQEPPRIASKFWDEYSGKQKLLQHFFGKSPSAAPTASTSTSTSSVTDPRDNHGVSEPSNQRLAAEVTEPPPSSEGPTPNEALSLPLLTPPVTQPSQPTKSSQSSVPPPLSPPPVPQTSQPAKSSQSSTSTTLKRKLTTDTLTRGSSSKKKPKQSVEKKNVNAQATLASFFAKPKTLVKAPSISSTATSTDTPKPQEPDDVEAPVAGANDVDIDADHRLALLVSSEEAGPPRHPSVESIAAKQVWSNLMAPIQPPKCTVHGESAKELTVTKPGPNKGKKFFICSRYRRILTPTMLAGTARAGPSLLQQNALKFCITEASPGLQQQRHMSMLKRARRRKETLVMGLDMQNCLQLSTDTPKSADRNIKRNAQGQIIPEKKEKSLGAFRPLAVSNLNHELFEVDKRTELKLPKFAPIQKLIGKATEFPVLKNDPARIYGLPTKMLLEFRILSKPCSVVRTITVKAANILEKAKTQSSLETRLVLTGRAGCGKSFLMLQLVEHCIQNDWIVLYIPRAKKLVDSSTPHEYDLRTRTYLQPSFSLQTLQRLQAANQAKLGTLTTHTKHVFEKREVPLGTNLNDFIGIALKEPSLAPLVLEAIMLELSAQTRHPVLFAVDDFQALYCRTAYRDPHFVPIHSFHLSLPRMILEFASGKRSFAKGAFVGAISTSETIYKTPAVLKETLNLPDMHFWTPYDKRSRLLMEYAEGLKELKVPDELSVDEAASLFGVWYNDKALVSTLPDETFLSKYTESSGNARDFVWKGLLATLDS